ncbi:hypothetical protein TRFO_08734 [Tritrichomonas foetus]|uniref:EF hand family protein n=1 Tax=Tritrichomonas foetus TaxID=1144522 RepID=A0A1J4JHU3_9EUKA|nr:hypothetical protein TRFO_08734 [Tritrichomonas foetus]|eukprot:OHS98730.1 hypothetical protein TRFO_08734 [Tritrichomonas foetus]
MVDIRPPATILQFSATINSRRPEDKMREFVIAYYLEDQAFSVAEKRVPNSGFGSGQFLKKTVVNNPKTGKPYEPREVYVGAVIDMGGWQFTLQEASEDALKVMEAHSDVFTKCDLNELLKITRERMTVSSPECLVMFQKYDTRKRGYVTLAEVQEVLLKCGIDFGDQEFLTLFRRYQVRGIDFFDYQSFVRNLV